MLIVFAPLLLASPLVARPLEFGDGLFAPEKGLKVERATKSSFDLELDTWTVQMNGQPVPEEYLPQLGVKSHSESLVRTLDTYLACADGKPTSLRRAFLELSAKRSHEVSLNGAPQSSGERIGTSALQGCVVLFDERAKEAGERRKLEQGKCDQALADALEIDEDLTEFLPPDAKSNAWDVPASAFNLFDENLRGIEFTYDKPEEQTHSDPVQFAHNAEGKWHVERGEARDEAGVHVLPLKITGKLKTFSEIESELKNVPVASGPTSERGDMTLDVKGEIVWDLQHHVLQSVKIEGASAMTYKTTTKKLGDSGEPAYEQEMNFKGTLTLAIETKIAQ